MQPILYNANGEPIEHPKCQCGKDSSTFIQSRSCIKWMCNDCLHGVFPSNQPFTFAQFGGTMDCVVDGERKNMADHLNEIEWKRNLDANYKETPLQKET